MYCDVFDEKNAAVYLVHENVVILFSYNKLVG